MNKLLITYGWGEENEELHRITLPGKEAYARLHGYDLWCPTREKFKNVDDGRHPSWFKIKAIQEAIANKTSRWRQERPNTGDYAFARWKYDTVLWLDADVGIVDPYIDILSHAVGARPFHCVTHHTADGAVPNCGVWLVKDNAAGCDVSSMLDAIWNHTTAPRVDHWWEQAAFIDLYANTVHCNRDLHLVWNPHLNDKRGWPGAGTPKQVADESYFFHATQWPDRASELKKRCFI
jgi:hypothetical protein